MNTNRRIPDPWPYYTEVQRGVIENTAQQPKYSWNLEDDQDWWRGCIGEYWNNVGYQLGAGTAQRFAIHPNVHSGMRSCINTITINEITEHV